MGVAKQVRLQSHCLIHGLSAVRRSISTMMSGHISSICVNVSSGLKLVAAECGESGSRLRRRRHSGQKKFVHVIDQDECVQCGKCAASCECGAFVKAGAIKPRGTNPLSYLN
jgi:NAD-dependent dihydropyrimidine dehydrogenase PreA subunit